MNKSGFVSIIGRPNAGKSTLLNRVLGSKLSIVTPKAQTTRNKVLGILTEEAGQIVFLDTPGIHKARVGGINEFMVQEAASSLDGSNVVWYLVDPASGLEHEETVVELLQGRRSPIILLFNKHLESNIDNAFLYQPLIQWHYLILLFNILSNEIVYLG